MIAVYKRNNFLTYDQITGKIILVSTKGERKRDECRVVQMTNVIKNTSPVMSEGKLNTLGILQR